MKFIEIDKKKYPVSFNMAALLEAQDSLEITIEVLLTQIDTLSYNQLMRLYYLGLKFGADEFDRKCQITYSAFVEYTNTHREVLEDVARIVMEDLLNTVKVMSEQAKVYNEASEEPAKKKKKASGLTTSG